MKAFRSCDPELFEKVHLGVTTRQAAEYCGVIPNRRGLCLCPFHSDSHPSLQLYDGRKGFYCFSCHTGGDCIRFVALFFRVSDREAALLLAEAFQIPVAIPMTYREKREVEKRWRRKQEVSAWQRQALTFLSAYRQLLCEAIHREDPEDPCFVEALQNLTYMEYLADQIEKDPEEVFLDKKAVKKIGEVRERVIDWYGSAESWGAVSG